MSQGVLILVTIPGEKASDFSRLLVEEKLCACVNILPEVRSLYEWQGKIEDESESLLFIKSTKEKLSLLEKRVHELHPYDTPEFVVLHPAHISEKYDAWLCDVTS